MSEMTLSRQEFSSSQRPDRKAVPALQILTGTLPVPVAQLWYSKEKKESGYASFAQIQD